MEKKRLLLLLILILTISIMVYAGPGPPPTVFTTNYTDKPSTTYRETSLLRNTDEGTKEIIKRETLEQRVYSRIYSRLKEMAHFVELKGGDHRQPAEEYRV